LGAGGVDCDRDDRQEEGDVLCVADW
jgi:hypothetical protein